MSRVYLSSDWHLGHKNLHKFGQRPGVSVDDNYDFIGDNYNLCKRDHLILLGDIIFEERAFKFVQSLTAASKRLVIGNHDWERFKGSMSDVAETFDSVHGALAYGRKECKSWLTHIPIHPSEMRGKRLNIHGHLHVPEENLDVTDDPLYFNVNVDSLYPSTGEILINYQEIFSG